MYDLAIQNEALYLYLKKYSYPFTKSGRTLMVKCPFCGEMSAHKLPHAPKFKCQNPLCEKGKKAAFTLLYLIKQHQPEFQGKDNETILQFLKETFKLSVKTENDIKEIQDQLDFYHSLGWSLLPCEKPGKFAVAFGKKPYEAGWQKKIYKEKNHWQSWLSSGLNIGVLCGSDSNVFVMEIDVLTNEEATDLANAYLKNNEKKIKAILAKKVIPEEVLKVLGDTLVQESFKGFHFYYQYDSEIPKTCFDYKGVHIDVEAAGGQVVINPSVVEIEDVHKTDEANAKLEPDNRKVKIGTGYLAGRQFLNRVKPIKINEKLKQFILENSPKSIKKADNSLDGLLHDERFKGIFDTDFNVKTYGDRSGRNNLLLGLAGKLRSRSSIAETKHAMNVINYAFFTPPLPQSELETMVGSIENYMDLDVEIWKEKIIKYLEDVKDTTRNAITQGLALGDKKEFPRIERALRELFEQEKVRFYRNKIILNERALWSDSLFEAYIPLGFKVPYFDDMMQFFAGDIILIGGVTSAGKTHLSMNFVRKLVMQGVKPYYLSTESGSRYIKVARALNIPDKSFYHLKGVDPYQVQFEKNAVTILDWLDPDVLGESGFARVNTLMREILHKTEKQQGLTIVFMQLKEDETWFSKNMVKSYPALATRFRFERDESGKFIRTKPYFDFEPGLSKVRDPKSFHCVQHIPLIYLPETKELLRRDEVEKEKHD